jgi:para-nitrobenzyl esterase
MGVRMILALALTALPVVAGARTIHVEGGDLAGPTGSKSDIRVYRAIPYAAPPTGNLRWRAPQPVIPWQGLRKADQFSPTCMQPERPKDSVYSPGYEPASEDCLYLNLWTPARSAKDRLPVMVWIHGGGFRFVSGSEKFFDGERLATKGVVVVTFNYRLGVFGFLAHQELSRESDHHVSGNYGLLDQIAALRWVESQSAGANSVCYLVASPLARGLFVYAIGESVVGCLGPPAETASLESGEQAGAKFLAAAKVGSIAELRAQPARDLLAVNGDFSPRALADGYFLLSDPYTIFRRGQQNRVPLLVGSNGDEGTLLGRPPESAAAFAEQARLRFGDRTDAFLKIFPADSDAQAKESNYALWRDQVAWQARMLARLETGDGRVKAYRYYFSHKPPIPEGMFREQARNELGAYHSSEIEYVFDNLATRPYLWNDSDRKLAKLMSGYWVNFAKTGDPNGPGLPNWPACDPKHDLLLEFGDTVEPRPNFDKAALDFFETSLSGEPAD